jgi:hypothetical protein
MQKNIPFKGIISYAITPFTESEAVDIPLFKKLLALRLWAAQVFCLISLTKKKKRSLRQHCNR